MSVNKIEEDKYQDVSGFDDDFDIDARPSQATSTTTAIGSGWDDAEKLTVSTSQYPTEFRQSDREQLIKFIDPNGPFATYKMHFLSQKTEGKRSYVCLGAVCPLCNILGHKAEDKRSFTIVNFSADTGFTRQILTATPRLYRTLAQANAEKFGPLNKHFWSLSRTGKMQTTVYNLIPVKERDLSEEYDLNIDEVNDFLSAVEPYVRSDIREHSVAELTEIANDLL
jgi:hypothetical protein